MGDGCMLIRLFFILLFDTSVYAEDSFENTMKKLLNIIAVLFITANAYAQEINETNNILSEETNNKIKF